jgi:hypothetical protein
MPGLAYDRCGELLVVVMGREAVPDAEWDGYLDFIARTLPAGRPARALVFTDGAAPTPAQRTRLDQQIHSLFPDPRVALITGSTFARGVLNAIAFFSRGYRAFAPDQLRDAFAYLGIAPSAGPQVELTARVLRGAIGAR